MIRWLKSFWKGLKTPLVHEKSFRPARENPDVDESLKNFAPRALQALKLARKEAERFNHCFVGTEHLLLGIVKLGQGVAVEVLTKMGIELETIRLEIEKQVGLGPDQKAVGEIPYTPRVKKVLKLASKESTELGHKYVGTEHLLLGLLREDDGVAARFLKNLGVGLVAVRNRVREELEPNFSSISADITTPPKEASQSNSTTSIDLRKRYDIYCSQGGHEMIYRNALFKGIKKLFRESESDVALEYIELEEADGSIVFVARSTVIKFLEHRKA